MDNMKIDFDAVNPIEANEAPVQVEEVKVVFVPFEDTELTVNRQTKYLYKGRSVKVSRDEARILLEAHKGYCKD